MDEKMRKAQDRLDNSGLSHDDSITFKAVFIVLKSSDCAKTGSEAVARLYQELGFEVEKVKNRWTIWA